MELDRDVLNKKVMIYGTGKHYQDFKYIFSSVEIVVATDKLQEIEDTKKKYFTIVCMGDEKKAGIELDKAGFLWGEDYCLASDLFKFLEPIQTFRKQVYVWGRGCVGEHFHHVNEKFGFFHIVGYIDSQVEQGMAEAFFGHTVWNPQDITYHKDIFIWVATTRYYSEIKDELLHKGLKEGVHFNQADASFGIITDMMHRTYFDLPDVENKFICTQPFEYIQVDEGGKAYCCCPDYVNRMSIGNIRENSFDEIWNSILMKIFRLSVLNGTYSFCNHQLCMTLKETEKSEKAERKTYFYAPERLKVDVNIDGSCNLYCTSCRNQIYVKDKEEVQAANLLAEKIQREIIKKATDLYLSGYGEVFLSKVYRKILQEVTRIDHIGLLTNGTLFDRNFFDKIREKCNKISIFVSVDAACKETYEKVRRGGSFARLCDNLEYIGVLRRQEIVDCFMLNYVVQYANKDEIKLFAEWGERLGADRINYTRINNWGTYTEEEFDSVSLFNRNGKLKRQYEACFEGLDEYRDIVNTANLGIEDMQCNTYLDFDLRSLI